MASSIFVLWNPLVGTKILPLFAQVGDSFFRGQFVHSSLQLAQVAVDGGLRGAQLGGDLADGALHIKDARMVQRLHDADLFFHGQPVGRQPGAAGHLGTVRSPFARHTGMARYSCACQP